VGVAAAVAGNTKKPPPLIDLKGGSYTTSVSPVGAVVTGRVQFNINAQESAAGAVSGTLAVQVYGCLTNGTFDPTCSGPDTTLYQLGHTDVKIACLSADKPSGTVWLSGRVLDGDDQRVPAELRQQEQDIIAQRNMIFVGRFQDINGDGTADNRSLFLTLATTSYPNVLTTNGDIGTPWYNGTTSGASACLARDSGTYIQADYQVVNGAANTVQWLEPDDSTPVGSPFQGTAANLATPPAASLYNLASITRVLQSPGLKVAIQ
jgi:hypothetical protein